MRLFIIGRIFTEDKLVGYKLYDANAKTTGIYPKENVWYRLRESHMRGQGILIVGLRVTADGSITGVHDSFNITKTDIVNGEGEPIGTSRRYTLLGFSGLSDATRYRLVDSLGVEKIVSKEEFEELLKEDKVNGAKTSTRIKGRINIYKHCNHREYNY